MKHWLKVLVSIAVAVVALLALAVATRSYWLPERFTINVPLRSIVGSAPSVDEETVVRSLVLPQGFTLTRFANGLNNARFLRVTTRGDVVVSQPREGRVTLLFEDGNQDGSSDGTSVLLAGLDRPHGLALHEGYLYVAEMTAIGRISFDASSRQTSGSFERVVRGLPSGGNHWTRTIGFGPDGHLYVSVGSSCNVCVEDDPRRAAISRYDPSTWRGSVFASGLRNAVGFAWRERDGGEPELFATDNGRDLLGNDFPPCELNLVVEGGFYGWPYANGNRIPDPDLGRGRDREIGASVPPVHDFPAHNAPLGIAFLDSPATEGGYRGAALVALHGSWNRTTKDGYKVVSLHWDDAGSITQRDFLTGFLNAEEVIGRPVDIAQGLDGSIYISDDFGGAVYKVTRGQRGALPVSTAAPASGGRALPPPPADAATTARGRAIWVENQCDMCHDPALVGKDPDMPITQLLNIRARYDVETMVTYLAAPQPPMPLFEMSAEERRDLAVYVLSRFP